MDIGKKIQILRKRQNYSQGELAEIIRIKGTKLSKIENGFNKPSIDTLVKIADALHISLDYLIAFDPVHSETQKDESRGTGLYEKLRLIDALDKNDRDALITVIDAMITKKRITDLLKSRAK